MARDQFDHPPCRPDLAPSDFHFFLHRKLLFLAGKKFNNGDELKERIINGNKVRFYDEDIQKLD